MRMLMLVFGLLLPILFVNNMKISAEINLNAKSNEMQQSDKFTITLDDITGEIVEHTDSVHPFTFFSVTESSPVQVNRIENIFPLAKQGAENFTDSMKFKYTVNSSNGFSSDKHIDEISKGIRKLFEDGSYISGTIKSHGYQIRYIPGVTTTDIELTVSFTYRHTAAQERELTMGINSIAAMIPKLLKPI